MEARSWRVGPSVTCPMQDSMNIIMPAVMKKMARSGTAMSRVSVMMANLGWKDQACGQQMS
eukprot:scaffold86993_cov40-Prasinocladus_malaysianus.AAC.1